jgi:uncharacterized glyoxalase superfamily protein PhnB
MSASVETSKPMVKPKFRSAVPTFLVPDVGETGRWYETNLGFTVSALPKNEPYFFASLQRQGVELMLLSMENYKKEQISRTGGNWDAYIRMEGVHEFYEEVRQKIPIRMELVRQPYGNWEFEVFDPNGYVLVFGGDEERS